MMNKLLLSLVVASTCMATPVIEKEDRRVLKPFFKYLITKENLGFVLFGTKPAVLIGYVDALSWWHPIESLRAMSPYYERGNQQRKKAWETWRKYSSGISDRFVILEEYSDWKFDISIFIINRELFCKTVNENLDDFEKVLNRKITGEQLLEEAKHQSLFTVLLKKNEALLGLILGYGKNNSLRFSTDVKMKGLGIFPKEADQFGFIDLPVFRADWNDPETHELRMRYLNCRRKIIETYMDKDLFEETLKILFGEGSP